MAILAKGILFSGTIGDFCFYIRAGRTHVRNQSSLTRKRVLKAREFARTRQYAGDMGHASQIASIIYQSLPVKGRWLFRAITGEAVSLLYEGKPVQEVKENLWRKYILNTDNAD